MRLSPLYEQVNKDCARILGEDHLNTLTRATTSQAHDAEPHRGHRPGFGSRSCLTAPASWAKTTHQFQPRNDSVQAHTSGGTPH